MLLSELEVKTGVIPGARFPALPAVLRDPRIRALRNMHAWRRFQLGDIETVTVTPPVDLSTVVSPPPALPDFITPLAPDVQPPTISMSDLAPIDVLPPTIDIQPPAALTAPSLPSAPVSVAPSTPAPPPSPSIDWFGDLTKLAQVAGQTVVGYVAAEHGLPPGVTGVSPGAGISPGMSAAQLAMLSPAQRAQYAAMYPGAGASGSDLLTQLMGGGSSMTTLLLLSGVGLVAFIVLSRK